MKETTLCRLTVFLGWGKKCRVLAVTVSVRYCRHLGSFTPAPALMIRFPGLAWVLVRAVRQLLSASLGWRWRILDQVSLWLLVNMDKYTFLFLELNLQCSNIIRINQTPDSPVLSLYQLTWSRSSCGTQVQWPRRNPALFTLLLCSPTRAPHLQTQLCTALHSWDNLRFKLQMCKTVAKSWRAGTTHFNRF